MTAEYKAEIVPVPDGGPTVKSETVTTIIVTGVDGHELMRGEVGVTDGIVSVKMVAGQTMRCSVPQMDGLEALAEEWRKIRRSQ